MGALAAGAMFGLAVARPAEALVASTAELGKSLEPDQWGASSEDHLLRASRARVGMIEKSREVNRRKTRLLKIGVWCAAAGIVFLLAAAIVALALGPRPAAA